jgi:UDP-N-acetylglucosamine--N-acetylmuramyl-(pentapeptide) pyrophosphoryl-undecaprenol N-acetylglucosamine transferase
MLVSGKHGTEIYPFIDDIPKYLRAADIVISRSGAMTLSEVAAVGAVPILIPSPNVTDNHQYKNARLLSDRGAAIIIEEKELSERTLLDAVRYLEANPGIRAKMSKELASFHIKNSREMIYEELLDVLRRRNNSALK